MTGNHMRGWRCALTGKGLRGAALALCADYARGAVAGGRAMAAGV